MDKKAQGLSLNTIIIAIIVLIVLVVIILVFTGAFGTIINPGIADCLTKPNQKCSSGTGVACGSANTEVSDYPAPGVGNCKDASGKIIIGNCCLGGIKNLPV